MRINRLLYGTVGCAILWAPSLLAQPTAAADSLKPGFNFILDANPRTYQRNDSVWIRSGICKVLRTTFFKDSIAIKDGSAQGNRKTLLCRGEGEFTAQYFHRSGSLENVPLLNTTSQVAALRLQLIYKETYPVSLFFRYNESTPFQLDNQYEFNLAFDDRSYKELLRDRILSTTKKNWLAREAALRNRFENIFRQYDEQKQIIASPEYAQRSLEERFRENNRSIIPAGPNTDVLQRYTTRIPSAGNPGASLPGLNTDLRLPQISSAVTVVSNAGEAAISSKESELQQSLQYRQDSLLGLLKKYEDSLSTLKAGYNREVDSLNQNLSATASRKELKKWAEKSGLPEASRQSKWGSLLSNTELRLGKFLLTSSELTVNNIFIHGASIRYGDEKFLQVSGGYYDYGFRELFRFQRDTSLGKRTSLVAIKLGRTDGKNLQAVNFYIGKKAGAGGLPAMMQSISGLSIERKFYINKNFGVELELAKSTSSSLHPVQQSSVFKTLFTQFSIQTMGAHGAVSTHLKKTNTDAEVAYRYWGSQFESFNVNQYYNPQHNFNAKVSQPLFKRKLLIVSGFRYTNFTSDGVASNLHSKTLFASVNATVRIRKWPVLTGGYYPGSQLYLVNHEKLYEYFYYICNITASHYFTLAKMPMQVVATASKFYNRYSDSIINRAQSGCHLFWSGWAGRWNYNASYSWQDLRNGFLGTSEAGVTYTGTVLKLGGTIKWNVSETESRPGYSGSIGLLLKSLGTLSLRFDKSFLPGVDERLVPVSTGQIQFIKPLKFRIWQKE